MVRQVEVDELVSSGSPHSRGDGPSFGLSRTSHRMFSPLAWGWSVRPLLECQQQCVLPTRVGMVRESGSRNGRGSRSPHSRGDGPEQDMPSGLPICVLPTRVGMVRLHTRLADDCGGSPHSRGDGPGLIKGRLGLGRFSPLAWGWSEIERSNLGYYAVLPTRVGMVRSFD